MTTTEYKIKKAKDAKAWATLFDAKDVLIECGWNHEAEQVNKIISANIPF